VPWHVRGYHIRKLVRQIEALRIIVVGAAENDLAILVLACDLMLMRIVSTELSLNVARKLWPDVGWARAT
jgi:hypothetical protein